MQYIKYIFIIFIFTLSVSLVFHFEFVGINSIEIKKINNAKINCSYRAVDVCKFNVEYNETSITGYAENCSDSYTKNATLFRGTALVSRSFRYYLICDD